MTISPDPSWFTIAPQDRNTLLLRSMIPNSELNVAAEPLRSSTHVHKSKSGYLPHAGLVRVLAWLRLRDLAELLEIYGVPISLGKYPPNSNHKKKQRCSITDQNDKFHRFDIILTRNNLVKLN